MVLCVPTCSICTIHVVEKSYPMTLHYLLKGSEYNEINIVLKDATHR